MSKSSKKAKKAARRQLKKVQGTCLKCGGPLRGKDRRCPACRRPSPLYMGKSASALLTKSADGKVTPIWAARWRRVCPYGHRQGKMAGQFCADCGTPLGVDEAERLAWVAKSAPGAGSYLERQLAAETDPGLQQFFMHQMYEQAAARGEVVPFIAKAYGYGSVEEAWRAETDPALQQMFWNAMHPYGGSSA